MIQAIDHIVILVSNLEQATNDYQALGFHVVPGGEHTGGASHNVLVSFADGTYLELIAFKRAAPEHTWWPYATTGEGLIDFALLPSDIANDLEAARTRGLALAGPFPGGRLRPDGVRIDWQTGRSPTRDLPFFCADVTPRSLRVPHGDAWQHPNGAQGIATLTIAVHDIATSVAHYQALLGHTDRADIKLGNSTIRLTADEHAAARIALRGEGPLALAIRTADRAPKGPLDRTLTHGVPIELV